VFAFNTIQQAFREAARKETLRRPFIPNVMILGGLALTAITLVVSGVGGMTELYEISANTKDFLYSIADQSTFLGLVAKLTFDDIRVFERQFDKSEKGYTLLPDAKGNQRVYEGAQSKIDKFLEAQRPGAQGRASEAYRSHM
jgi:hypothetical protein